MSATPVAYATSLEEFSGKAIMAVEYSLRDLTEKQLEYVRANPELLEKRLAKDIEYLCKRTDQEIIAAAIKAHTEDVDKDVSIRSTSNVYKGNQYHFFNAPESNKGGYRSALAYYNANAGTPNPAWADASAWSGMIGSAGGWAYVGKKIKVKGSSGEKIPAVITFQGKAKGDLLAGPGGAANGRVKVTVLDLSSNSVAAEATIWEKSSQNNQPQYFDANINRQLSLFLIAGRTYLLYESVGTDISNLSLTTSTSNFWSNGSGPKGLDWTKVIVDTR
jgi:hypothetical protein